MADIGSTLRETRIRDKIDITLVEESTKIRAKYLRALENEEWSVLPGPTYVKSFLRTYAEFLGLDAHMLVEEYRARYEQPEELEVPAFAHTRPLRGRVRPPGPPSRAVAIGALAFAFLALLFVLGITAGDESDESGGASERRDRAPAAAGTPAAKRDQGEDRKSVARTVTVTVVAARPVWVCLQNAAGKRLIEGRTLESGAKEGPFRSRRFEITVGNGGGDLRLNGKLRDLPETSAPQGYAISRSGLRGLAESRRPTCEAQGASPADRSAVSRPEAAPL